MGKNFENTRKWRNFCKQFHAWNEIFLDFNTVDMFSKYVWHIHNLETLLKLFLELFEASVTDIFENFPQMKSMEITVTVDILHFLLSVRIIT